MQSYNPAPRQQKDETGGKIRRFVVIVAGVLIVGFLVVHFIKSFHEGRLEKVTDESASAPSLVNIIQVVPAPATVALTLPGAAAAWYESTIYARVDGYVGKWDADIGDSVKKGQVLATIETPDLDAQLAAAKALVISRKAAAEFARTTYERWRGSPKGVVSEQEREEKKAEFDSAAAQLSLAQADVDRYTALAQFKRVVAPYDGTITERRIDIGNLVMAGSSSNTTSLYKMAKNNPIRVFVDVPQSAAGDMKVGVAAKISASNIPNHIFKGTIARTADAIDPQARTLKVEVDIPNPDQALLPGMYVDVKFGIPTKGLLQVPAAALVFRSGGPQVAVVDKEGRVTFHKVSIARDNGNTVELGSGVEAGDSIALNISSQIAEGQIVKINESTESTANASASGK